MFEDRISTMSKPTAWSILSLLFLSNLNQVVNAGTGLRCPITWESSGFGRFPKHSVAAGVKNFVSRIAVPGTGTAKEFYGGHLSFPEGVTYAVQQQQAIESETYSVLTNPNNCSLVWVPIEAYTADNIVLPPNNSTAVKIDESKIFLNTVSYVGRSVLEGTFRSGAVVHGFSTLFCAYEGTVHKFREFELLTSEQPSLHVSLSKFKFTLNLQAIETESKLELFSVDHLDNVYNQRVDYTIMTEGPVDEHFILMENIPIGWRAVSRMDLNMVMWFGSPAVKEKSLPVNMKMANVFGVRSDRERELRIRANFSNVNEEKAVACSFRVVLEDYEIDFEATGKFYPDYESGQNYITREHIQEILTLTGRNTSTFKNLPDGGVQAIVRGKISGRFALRTFLYAEAARDPVIGGIGPCDRHLM